MHLLKRIVVNMVLKGSEENSQIVWGLRCQHQRFPPTAIKKCDQPYAMGHYPVVSECNVICGEFIGSNKR
jgi:hypothetical protein